MKLKNLFMNSRGFRYFTFCLISLSLFLIGNALDIKTYASNDNQLVCEVINSDESPVLETKILSAKDFNDEYKRLYKSYRESKKKTLITSNMLNVRTSPEIGDNISSTMSQYSEVVIFDELINDEWYTLFDETNGTKYVNAKYLITSDEYKKILEEKEKEKERKKAKIAAQMNRGGFYDAAYSTDYISTSMNVFTPSGYTVTSLRTVLANKYPALVDIAEAAIDVEETYGINALFTVSVALHESAHGKIMAGYNNVYGMKDPYNGGWKHFNNKSEGVYWFANSIISYKVCTISRIASIYCPDGTPWAEYIVYYMKQL